MERARLAEPGERFVVFGARDPAKNGLTGRALYFLPTLASRMMEARHRTRGPYMAIKIDGFPPPHPPICTKHLRHWCATQRVLWAIDGHDPATDQVHDTREVRA